MPWKMLAGCPIYRRHQGAGPAHGIFIDGRLAVFYSRGDLGAAWGSVGYGRKRKNVELAFRMGINLLTYSLLYSSHK